MCSGSYLSHCPGLRISQTTDKQGNRWLLLGLAVQTKEDKPDPSDELAAATRDTIPELRFSWAGRWLLIGDNELHMDCSGLLGCFYGTKNSGSGKELWVSSSPAILADVLGVDKRLSYKIEHGYGIDWYIPPRSGIDSINRLLPSQILNFATGKVSSRQLVPSISRALSCEKVLDQLQTYYITALKRISRTSNRLWLALTGGGDSRTLLAVANHAGVPVIPYTHHHAHLTHADLTLPPKLAKAVGMDHTFFRGSEYSADREKTFDDHTAGHSVDRDRFYYARDYFNWCRKGDTILRSHGVEIGRWARDRFPLREYGPSLPEAEEILAKYKERGFKYAGRDSGGSFPPSMYEALGDWVTWSRNWPQGNIDWRDRLWIEQCLAGWLSSIEQSLDLIDAERFYPANSQHYFALVLQIPEEMRHPKRPLHQHELIRRMTPELLEFPFNPPEPVRLHECVFGRLKCLIRIIAGKGT